MRRYLLINIILCLMILGTIPSNTWCADFVDGIANLSDKLANRTPVKVEVHLKKISLHYPYQGALLWGGDMKSEEDVVMPKTVISSMSVLIGNKKSFIRLSAYSDLGNPNHVSFKRTKKGFRLMIQGGDAAGSYSAVLEFNDQNIEGRKVTHGEFPNQVWEETTYSFISEDSEM